MNMEKDHLDPIKSLEYEFTDKYLNLRIVFHVALDYANEKKYSEAH